jgi:2'-hydroxyisoflavone reductase
LKLLMLGGTVFLGRHLADLALTRGHEVTLFNRGRHNPDLFPQAVKVTGDRDGGLAALPGGRWDAVIDTCGYLPRIVAQSADLLASRVDAYVFISSISVYRDFAVRHLDEDYPVAELPDPTVETTDKEAYGGLKALCERAVTAALPGRALIIRPGLIVGPHDPTDRFTYWPVRVARGGEVLAPGAPAGELQFIDVRDLAEWILARVEDGERGVFNATGYDHPLTFARLLEECKRTSGSDAAFTWVSEAFLLEKKVAPWIEIPLWVPQEPDSIGIDSVRIDRALNRGLAFRPLVETIRDTLAWAATLPGDRVPAAGLAAEMETELLRQWKEEPRS